ncbi:SPFH domain-containing protein [Gorillibacterium sp. sgz5001074]|uniref:SPFH domain-containing protein n=1 Tax=Gorillibacterium sp. sgz5001074 TaxID=3446695 RepID=UPI003F67DB97
MQLYSVIKNDGPGEVLAWKFLGEDFNTGSQLIVAESEEALFFKDGIIEQTFEGGKYTLGTNNYPFISKFISSFSGGVSAFNCKVYFINKVHKLELFWGTDTPIQMRDPVFMLQTSIQARGSYSIQIADSKKFLLKLIGNNIQYFTQEELNGYFRNAFMQYIKDEIPRVIKESGREILDVCTEKTKIAESLTPLLNGILDEYGVRLVNFYISAIDIPENDPSRERLEQAYANKAVMGVLGQDWGRQQSVDILKDLAHNPEAGGVAAAGAALGMGIAAGGIFGDVATQMFAPMMNQQIQPEQPRPEQAESGAKQTECPSCGVQNVQGAKFCNECGTKLLKEKKYCGNCGAEMPETAKFCNECGTRRM